jgi:hypothetical protein
VPGLNQKRRWLESCRYSQKKLNGRGIGLNSWGAFSEKLNEKGILSEIIWHNPFIQKVMPTTENCDFSEVYGSAVPYFWNQYRELGKIEKRGFTAAQMWVLQENLMTIGQCLTHNHTVTFLHWSSSYQDSKKSLLGVCENRSCRHRFEIRRLHFSFVR